MRRHSTVVVPALGPFPGGKKAAGAPSMLPEGLLAPAEDSLGDGACCSLRRVEAWVASADPDSGRIGYIHN